jgi:hypothetical protein
MGRDGLTFAVHSPGRGQVALDILPRIRICGIGRRDFTVPLFDSHRGRGDNKVATPYPATSQIMTCGSIKVRANEVRKDCSSEGCAALLDLTFLPTFSSGGTPQPRGQRSEVRGQRSEVRGQRSEISPSPHLPISPSPHLPISPSPHLPYPPSKKKAADFAVSGL